ncbi:MAG: hypothetical protein V2A71_04990 [Candidatus Eisenbacteria bacterium]
MKGMRGVIILIIVFVVAIFLGFLIGSKRAADLERQLADVKTEFEAKFVLLENETATAKAQKELAACKWNLVQTRNSASRRDFGTATASLLAARDACSKAVAVAPSEFAEQLGAFQTAIDQIKAALDQSDLAVVGTLEQVIEQMEAVVSR